MVHHIYAKCPYCTVGEDFKVINRGETGIQYYKTNCSVCKLEFHVMLTFTLSVEVQRKHSAYTKK